MRGIVERLAVTAALTLTLILGVSGSNNWVLWLAWSVAMLGLVTATLTA